jgi:N-acetylglucosaminyl-diphospho-decaprenol L-rhamnosyltransferase
MSDPAATEGPEGLELPKLPDLAVVVVSCGDTEWLAPCLTTLLDHAGPIAMDVVVVENGGGDATRALLAARFPRVRLIEAGNHGFAHANNRALRTCAARYVLLLNPDTEIVEGRLADLVAELDARPEVGVAGVRQRARDGTVWPTIRYFPSFTRALGESLGSERWPRRGRGRWAGERELDARRYDVAGDCDWTAGSFLLARREALLAAGLLDERFFLYSEEPDLCLRVRSAGWTVRHLPSLTIVHHAGRAGLRPRLHAQAAYARRQYAQKHFSPGYAAAYVGAVAAGHAVRALVPGRGAAGDRRRAGARLALRTLVGRARPPFDVPPPTAVTER